MYYFPVRIREPTGKSIKNSVEIYIKTKFFCLSIDTYNNSDKHLEIIVNNDGNMYLPLSVASSHFTTIVF